MSSIEVIDNFLDDSEYALIRDNLLSPSWPWFFLPLVDYSTDEELNDPSKFQFTYLFYSHYSPQNTGFEYIHPLVDKLNAVAFNRIRANLLTRTPQRQVNSFHTDIQCPFTHKPEKHITTAIYYVNSNNGVTLFETGEEVQSVANRLVKFPGSLNHTGTTCTDQKIRVVINLNYIPFET